MLSLIDMVKYAGRKHYVETLIGKRYAGSIQKTKSASPLNLARPISRLFDETSTRVNLARGM